MILDHIADALVIFGIQLVVPSTLGAYRAKPKVDYRHHIGAPFLTPFGDGDGDGDNSGPLLVVTLVYLGLYIYPNCSNGCATWLENILGPFVIKSRLHYSPERYLDWLQRTLGGRKAKNH